MTPYDKYMHDNRFHAVVDQFVDLLQSGIIDYDSIQQAATFACIRHSMLCGFRPHIVAIDWMHKEFEPKGGAA